MSAKAGNALSALKIKCSYFYVKLVKVLYYCVHDHVQRRERDRDRERQRHRERRQNDRERERDREIIYTIVGLGEQRWQPKKNLIIHQAPNIVTVLQPNAFTTQKNFECWTCRVKRTCSTLPPSPTLGQHAEQTPLSLSLTHTHTHEHIHTHEHTHTHTHT